MKEKTKEERESTEPEKRPEGGGKRQMGDFSKASPKKATKNPKDRKETTKNHPKRSREEKYRGEIERPAYPRLWQETKHESLGGSPVKAREKRLCLPQS